MENLSNWWDLQQEGGPILDRFFHLHLEQVSPLKGGDLKPCPGSQAPAEGLQQSASKGRHGSE